MLSPSEALRILDDYSTIHRDDRQPNIIDLYQRWVVMSTKLGGIGDHYYLAGKLAEEAGEVLRFHNKAYRDHGKDYSKVRDKVLKELGDVLWYICAEADAHGMTMSEVMGTNMSKLIDRRLRGVSHGDGDDR